MELVFQTSEARRRLKERQQDLAYRKIERIWRRVDDMRLSVEKQSRALAAVANLAALVGGLELVVLVEAQFNVPNPSQLMLACFALFSSLAVGAMVIAAATALMLMVRISHFDVKHAVIHHRALDFARYWQLRCKGEWWLCLASFVVGLPCLLVSLALLAWLRFEGGVAAPVIVSVVSGMSLLLLVWVAAGFWGATGFWGSEGYRCPRWCGGRGNGRSRREVAHAAPGGAAGARGSSRRAYVAEEDEAEDGYGEGSAADARAVDGASAPEVAAGTGQATATPASGVDMQHDGCDGDDVAVSGFEQDGDGDDDELDDAHWAGAMPSAGQLV